MSLPRILTKLVLGRQGNGIEGDTTQPSQITSSCCTAERVKAGTVHFEMTNYANELHSFKEITSALSSLPLSQPLRYGQGVPVSYCHRDTVICPRRHVSMCDMTKTSVKFLAKQQHR